MAVSLDAIEKDLGAGHILDGSNIRGGGFR
jgi:hypothetical protein